MNATIRKLPCPSVLTLPLPTTHWLTSALELRIKSSLKLHSKNLNRNFPSLTNHHPLKDPSPNSTPFPIHGNSPKRCSFELRTSILLPCEFLPFEFPSIGWQGKRNTVYIQHFIKLRKLIQFLCFTKNIPIYNSSSCHSLSMEKYQKSHFLRFNFRSWVVMTCGVRGGRNWHDWSRLKANWTAEMGRIGMYAAK